MRVRLRLNPEKDWVVESKCWHNILWQYEKTFYVYDGDAYERARHYAVLLKHPTIEEIT
jgi:hypothetical protein